MRIILAGLAGASLALAVSASVQAQTLRDTGAPMVQGRSMQMAQLDERAPRRRPRVRIYRSDDRGVYPSYNPGPNAVRDCSATYVQEFRPSGTVITPRLNCYWRRG
jgi:hypothetical protein